MKKFVLVLMLSLIVLAVYGCTRLSKNENELTEYTLNIKFTNKNHCSCIEQVSYVNHSNTPLNEIEFNLFPNAFRENSSLSVISLANRENCYYNGSSFGSISINSCEGAKSFEIIGKELFNSGQNCIRSKK